LPEEVDAIFLLPDIVTVAEIPIYYEATLTKGIPVVGVETKSVEQGALFSFGLDFEEVGHQAARMVDQILKGNSTVNDLPVEPTDFFLDINLVTADIIGLEISDEILEQARNIYRK
jgi:putative ABC transport system substrate-binding protein